MPFRGSGPKMQVVFAEALTGLETTGLCALGLRPGRRRCFQGS